MNLIPHPHLTRLVRAQSSVSHIPVCLSTQGLLCIKIYYDPHLPDPFWVRILDARPEKTGSRIMHYEPLAVDDLPPCVQFAYIVRQIEFIYRHLNPSPQGILYEHKEFRKMPLDLQGWETATLKINSEITNKLVIERLEIGHRICRPH